jgi:phosphatidylinositol alpha-1,6-mannosyltransferase
VTILVVTQVFPPAKGGSGTWLWELYRRLDEFNIQVIAGHADGDAAFDAKAPLAIARMPLAFSNWGIWNVRGAVDYARALRGLGSMVKRVRPDVLHCGKCLPEGLLGVAMKRWHGIPFNCFVHGEELSLAATSRELTRLTRAVLHKSARVIANSVHTKELLLKQWDVPDSSVAVMHPGVDTDTFAPAAPDRAVRTRLGWLDRRVILTVGALQKRKGQDMMIRALPAIRARCPDVLYSIVGQGWERGYLDDLVRQHGVADAVQFRGVPTDDELITFYQQCDLFALPNRQVGWDFEGFGIVLLEAQACGRPVVAGRSGGTAETLDPGRTGELVPCDTPEPLANVIADLLQNPGRRSLMGASARRWVVERFDWKVLRDRARSVFADSGRSSEHRSGNGSIKVSP